jgi:recyclin-1
MATRSNFKRALPQGQPSFMSSLRTPEPAADSKAILPAGKNIF